jgi:NAD(P)-dependent dehydrogenase (short-subunit alcohol dehydrogenase family)
MDEILATFRPDLFAGKRVLISGGTSGIGLALAKGFARLGAEVTATGASRARLDAAGRRSTLSSVDLRASMR